ncbi:hypothetical protein G9464_06515 [Halostella sp. JP-L12]|uniref:hypothetical protein n=1 Tax=Halostella TaxID=1843185 RepID=UPI000EF762BF|nr:MULTISPECIES: hypothetical protein [Halostella]NHN47250.1 hypothetical protein [Halostella sp. JP-L12]
MRFKEVPPAPDSLDFVADAQRAVPLVPGSEDDCCARLQRRTDVPDREAARTWLTFLRALGLAEETDAGYARTDRDIDREGLAAAFREGVFGAAEVASLLSDHPLTAAEAFEQFRPDVPQWERHRNPETWEDEWEGRVARLLEWAVLLGLAERTDAGYVAA